MDLHGQGSLGLRCCLTLGLYGTTIEAVFVIFFSLKRQGFFAEAPGLCADATDSRHRLPCGSYVAWLIVAFAVAPQSLAVAASMYSSVVQADLTDMSQARHDCIFASCTSSIGIGVAFFLSLVRWFSGLRTQCYTCLRTGHSHRRIALRESL